MALSLFPRFGTFFDDFDFLGANSGPAFHVRESDTALILELEVPRYRHEDITVEQRANNVLVVTGNRPDERPHHDQSYNQFLYGDTPSTRFRRAFSVPPGFDGSKATHSLQFGVLSIVIPRAAAPPTPTPIAIANTKGEVVSAPAPGEVKDKRGLIVTATSTPAEYNAVAKMKWPPQIKVDDQNDAITYTATMPPSVTADHIDLHFVRDGLRLGVHHQRQLVKKDDKGNVVFNEEQSVQYSTMLKVPDGTTAQDVSTSYDNGTLVVKVSKHPNPTQSVPVADKTAPK